MRRRQRYTVHRRLLLTFLLLGCAGSFVLGQELARAYTTLPVYAAQSLTFSGAGITASLVTPLQATGAVGQPTPQPKVVKHSKKPATTPKGTGPTTKPVAPPQPAPVTSPPIVLPGAPITPSPCVVMSCIPGAKPKPPVTPPVSAGPTGIAASGSSDAQVAQCSPLGQVTPLETTSPGAAPAHCADGAITGSAPQVALPAPVAPVVVPGVAPVVVPGVAPVVVPGVAPVVVPVMAPNLPPAFAPTEATGLSPATCYLASAPIATSADTRDQNAPVVSVAVVTCQEQQPAA